MLSLILADSELEIVPKEIQGHPSVVKNAKNRNKKPSSLLLDANYHHSAIRKKYPEDEEKKRRGRPDIAHLFALLALDSILNKEGRLEIYIHTRNNHVIYINPETRIPKAYHRFVGLIESLYLNKVIPDKTNPLMRLEENKNLKQLLKEIESDKIVTFSSNSKQINIKTYFQNFKADAKITCIIGGFPSGDFLSPIEDLSSEIISIYPNPLKTWTVISEILVNYENAILRENSVE